MNGKRWLAVVGMLVVVVAVSGCRRGPARGGLGLSPADIDPDFPGSDIFGQDIAMIGERFDYGTVLDIRFETVQFGFDSSQVAASEQLKIEAVADYMRRQPAVKAIVEGHTCDVGSREYNMALGERRALAVRAYLVQLGIDPGRVQTRSFGKEQPLQGGTSESARRLNRRAAFVMVQ